MDPVEQRGAAPSANYSIIANILGVGNGFPDTPFLMLLLTRTWQLATPRFCNG